MKKWQKSRNDIIFKKNVNIDEDEDDDTTFEISIRDNHVRFHGDLDQKSCFSLIEKLQEANDNVSKHSGRFGEPSVVLYINSGGGDVYAALGVVEYIRSLPAVTTICEGVVASAAVLISLAGTERFIGKHSYMMIHEIRSTAWGKFTELKDDMKNNRKLMKDMKKYFRERSGEKLPDDKLDDVLKHDILWSAKKCLKYGLVDNII